MVSNARLLKTLTLVVRAGLFWGFHDPPNSDKFFCICTVFDMNLRIFNVHVQSFCMLDKHTIVYWTSGSLPYPTDLNFFNRVQVKVEMDVLSSRP